MSVVGFIALGTNLGDREAHLRAGIEGISRRGLAPDAVSSVWETQPVDMEETGWFLNMVARVVTGLSPEEVLARLLDVEREVGRVRTTQNAPRILDLDLLVLGGHRRDGAGLVLPHPRMSERRFVLAPLDELAPDLVLPGAARTVREALEALRDPHVVRRVGALALPGARPL